MTGAEPVQTRARTSTDREESDVTVEDNSVRNTRTGHITVNGVSLMTLQKLKKPPVIKENLPGGTKKKNNKKNNEMTVPSSGKITNYLVRKNCNREEDARLKTDNKEDNISIEDTTNVEEDRRKEEEAERQEDSKMQK